MKLRIIGENGIKTEQKNGKYKNENERKNAKTNTK